MYPQGRPVRPRSHLNFQIITLTLSPPGGGGRFCPPLQRSQLNFPHGYVPACLYSILLLWLYCKMVLHCLEFFCKLYISHCPKEPSCFLWKRAFFLSGFKGTGNWLPFLSQERNTHCIKNDNSIQQYTSNWIPRKIRNLTVHIRKVLRFCPIWANFKILNKENVLLIVYYSNSFLKFKLKYQRRFESSYILRRPQNFAKSPQ